MTTPRHAEAEVDSLFIERWSPRSFKPDAVPEATLQSLFEAARWAPSCANGQPAIFLYSNDEESHARFLSALVPGNQVWAKQAPVLLFVAAHRTAEFTKGAPNAYARFDTGAAWMSFALAARMHGLYAHGMAGFDHKKTYELLSLPEEEIDLCAAVALGYLDSADKLPEGYREREAPNDRKPLREVAYAGRYAKLAFISVGVFSRPRPPRRQPPGRRTSAAAAASPWGRPRDRSR